MRAFRGSGFSLRLAGLAVLAICAVTHAQSGSKASDSPYQKDSNWPQLPQGMKLTLAIGMFPDADDNIWLLHRSDPPIIKFDPSGRILKSFGDKMFAQSHGFCMDRAGNLWAGDSRSFQFFKFNQDGKVLMTLGQAGVSRVGPDTFVSPTACIEAPNGDIIIADGHIPRTENQEVGDRLVRFSRDGKFIRDYGKPGRGPGEFRGPHQLAYDSQGRLFVADRQNNRLQIFDKNMNFVGEWKQFGRPSGLSILKDDTLMVIDSESGRAMTWTDWPGEDPKVPRNPGFTTGVRMGSARTGVVALHFEVPFSEAGTADSKGNVYIGGEGHKFVKRK